MNSLNKLNSKFPLVSIGIPTFNRSNGLYKALISVFAQKYPNLEVIISDNCSIDGTHEIVEEISKAHPEIKHYRQKTNIGLIANFEFVLQKATGKYFMWLGDDDRLEKAVVGKYVSFLESHPDYAIASGEIKYWSGNELKLRECGFTIDHASPMSRVVHYYAKVVYGGMMHGLMRRDLTNKIKLRSVIGNDFHFIATLAYLGKIKNFEFTGYHKSLGGTSKDFKSYAKTIGDSSFAGNFPYLKIAGDSFAEVMTNSSIYTMIPLQWKLPLAVSVTSGVFIHYYLKIYPRVIIGRIKSMLKQKKRVKNIFPSTSHHTPFLVK